MLKQFGRSAMHTQFVTSSIPTLQQIEAAERVLAEMREAQQKNENTLKAAQTDAKVLEALSTAASKTQEDIHQKLSDLQDLLAQEKDLYEVSTQLNALLKKLFASSKALDDNTTAKEFGEELSVVLKDSLQVDILKAALTLDAGLLERTLMEVAQCE